MTFFWAKALILFRTTSIPLHTYQHKGPSRAKKTAHLSSDALSSSTPSLYASPRSWCAKQCMLVVFPIPGMPYAATLALCMPRSQNAHRDDYVGAVSIAGDHFESLNSVRVPDDVVQHLWPVLLYPGPE